MTRKPLPSFVPKLPPWTSDEDEEFETFRATLGNQSDTTTVLLKLSAHFVGRRGFYEVYYHHYKKNWASRVDFDYNNRFVCEIENREASTSHSTQKVNKSSTREAGVLEMKTGSQMTGDGCRLTNFDEDKELAIHADCNQSTMSSKIAQNIADRTYDELHDHYTESDSDVGSIENKLVPLRQYHDSKIARWAALTSHTHTERISTKGSYWTADEHRLFLRGLKEHRKGAWNEISRDYVKTRTPAQVRSHAEKYYIHKDKRSAGKTSGRSSIFDITDVDDESLISPKERGLLPPDEASDPPHPDAQNP